MIGKHIVEQPLAKTLKQYRVLAIVSLTFIGYLMLRCWEFFEQNHETLSTDSAVGFFSYVAALLGAFVKSINNIQDKQED